MKKTDWENYYRKPFFAAKYTRGFLLKELIRFFECAGTNAGTRVLEYGGAGSFCSRELRRHFHLTHYAAADSCAAGLEILRREQPEIEVHQMDLLSGNLAALPEADLVFSVGLIEHFSVEDTQRIVDAHFAKTVPGGCVILFFPTPTRLYRFFRFFAEELHLWKFPDERPILWSEIEPQLLKHGTVLRKKLICRNVFTQYGVLVRKEN